MTPEEEARYDKALKNLAVANTLSATEASQYAEMGTEVCKYNITKITTSFDAEKICRQNLKYKAAERDADLMIIEANQTFQCDKHGNPGTGFECYRMAARFYKKRVAQN